jgi:hypothetical protein
MIPGLYSWASHTSYDQLHHVYYMYVDELLSSATDATCMSMFLVCVHVRTTHHQLHHAARFCSTKARATKVNIERRKRGGKDEETT